MPGLLRRLQGVQHQPLRQAQRTAVLHPVCHPEPTARLQVRPELHTGAIPLQAAVLQAATLLHPEVPALHIRAAHIAVVDIPVVDIPAAVIPAPVRQAVVLHTAEGIRIPAPVVFT